MRTYTTIGDTHGRNTWRRVPMEFWKIENKIIFLGDYCDSFYHTDQQIFDELEAIIDLKKQYEDQIVLLVGNHDIQYIFNDYKCSGYRQSMYPGLSKLFNQNKDLFQFAYQYKNYIWTHAGISNKWFSEFDKSYRKLHNHYILEANENIADCLNSLYYERFNNPTGQAGLLVEKLFTVSEVRGGLRGDISGPVWADLKETKEDYLTSYHQICGHTPVEFIATIGNKKQSITYTDCHRDRGDFLIKSI